MRPLHLGTGTSPQVGSGMNFPAVKLVEIFSAADWEGFAEEYANSVPGYDKVMRWSGPGDMGRDIVAFVSENKFDAPWDNYQCKRYGEKLTPSDIWVELGKIIYYSHTGEFKPPRNCFFAASKDIGLKLKKLLTNPAELKAELIKNWDGYCRKAITETKEIPLDGALKEYLDAFDFSIFKPISVVEMLKVHSNTVFYVQRFGHAGIPARPKPELPPEAIHERESRYVEQLLQAYAEHLQVSVDDLKDLSKWPEIEKHFNRAREVFKSDA